MVETLIIDNFDSFVYNLYQYVGELGREVEVVRNNVSIEEVEMLEPRRIIISPGPGRPEGAGVSMEVVRRLGESVPILGVCLGHQAIGAAYGAEIVRAGRPFHGKTSLIEHSGTGIFNGVENPFIATRYHSLVIHGPTLPEELAVMASAKEDGSIMAVEHIELPVFGLQFHPESILTANGKKLIKNFLEL